MKNTENIANKFEELSPKRKSSSKVNLLITTLPPEFAINVFSFVDVIFYSDLSLNVFKFKIEEFNVAEQYFIMFYLENYLDTKPESSYFNHWLKNKRHQFELNDELSKYSEFEKQIFANKATLEANMKTSFDLVKRRFTDLVSRNVPFDKYNGYFDKDYFNYRIPIHSKKKEFKPFFIEKMKSLLSPEEAEEMFYNSFEFGNDLSYTKLLHFPLADIKELRRVIIDIYDEYQKHYASKIRLAIVKFNKSYFETPSDRRKYKRRIDPKIPSEKEDFIKMVYNAFPYFRDKYSSQKEFIEKFKSNLVKGR